MTNGEQSFSLSVVWIVGVTLFVGVDCVHAGLISVDNLQLLCELLEEISRVDLSAKVKEFIHKKESEC